MMNIGLLEFSDFYNKCFLEAGGQNIGSCDANDSKVMLEKFLETVARRREEICAKGLLHSWPHRLDKWLWTDAKEHIDCEDFPPEDKQAIVNGLHLKNRIFGTYQKVFLLLKPIITSVNNEEKRPCRILELASGSGELALQIERYAARYGMDVEITGSDLFPEHVERGRRLAPAQGSRIRFVQLDALQLASSVDKTYDVAVILHGLHHFTPAEIVGLIKGALQVTTRGFLGVDGRRGILNMVFMAGTALFPSLFRAKSMYLHDALISAGKMYPTGLLDVFARVASSQAKVTANVFSLGLAQLRVCQSKENR